MDKKENDLAEKRLTSIVHCAHPGCQASTKNLFFIPAVNHRRSLVPSPQHAGSHASEESIVRSEVFGQ